MPVADLVIHSDMLVALVPIGFVMIVGFLTWMVRQLGAVSTALTQLTARGEALQAALEDQNSASTDDRRKFDQHVAADAIVAGKVAYIEGRLRGNGGAAAFH